MKKKLLYITSSLPSLTLTFVYREIFGLRERGIEIETVSMNRPSSDGVSEEAKGLLDSTCYLDQVAFRLKLLAALRLLFTRPRRVLECLGIFFSARPMNGIRDYARLGYHLLEACYLQGLFRSEGIDHIHSHFINGPTSLAMFLSVLLQKPFSFTMHASLIWLDPLAFRNKLERCTFCVSISEYNKAYVVSTYGEHLRKKIQIVHCGIHPQRMQDELDTGARDGERINILGVGQLTERKGFHVLIQTCAALKKRSLSFQCSIVGEGHQRKELESLIKSLDIADCVCLTGARPQEELPGFLASADIFVLPCVVAKDGWRDGIPVALMEAMYWRIPVISTEILGLPELIDSGKNGLLVKPEDVDGLVEAVISLAASSDTRRVIGAQAREKVLAEFNTEHSVEQLDALFNAR